jgi:hypothetical protein
MRVMFLTQWFEPEPIMKGAAFARALARAGHHVEVERKRPRISASYESFGRSRRDSVIPFRMECITLDVERGHLGVSHIDVLA